MKDEEAIQRIVLGETKAFETLVHRYRGLVFKVAYSITDNWHTAEDVAQETFLRAFQNLDRLRRPDGIRAWLVTTSKRLALRHNRARESERCIFVGLDPELFDSREDASYRWSQPSEVTVEVTSAISQLSEGAKEVAVLHYLEDLPLKAIAARLGIPVGTVKSRLHYARACLRKEMGIMKDVKHKLPAEGARINFWVDGGYDKAPFDEMRSFLSRSILWTVRVRFASVKQISEAVQSHPAYVRDVIDRMLHLEVLKETQRGRYIAADFFFDTAAAKRVKAWTEERGIKLAGRMMERMADIHALFEKLHLHPKGIGWDEVAWPLMAFLFVKPTVTKCVTEPIEIPLKPSGKHYFFQGADLQETTWRIIGRNMHEDEGWVAMQYWSPEVPPKLGLPHYHACLLEPLVENLEKGVAPDVLLERGAVEDQMELARLVERGVLSSSNGRIHLALPYLPTEEWETLRKDAEEFMEPLRDPICEMLHGAEALLDELGFKHLCSIYPEGKQLLASNIGGECLMALEEAGALPEIPDPTPGTWGTIIFRRRSR